MPISELPGALRKVKAGAPRVVFRVVLGQRWVHMLAKISERRGDVSGFVSASMHEALCLLFEKEFGYPPPLSFDEPASGEPPDGRA